MRIHNCGGSGSALNGSHLDTEPCDVCEPFVGVGEPCHDTHRYTPMCEYHRGFKDGADSVINRLSPAPVVALEPTHLAEENLAELSDPSLAGYHLLSKQVLARMVRDANLEIDRLLAEVAKYDEMITGELGL